MATPGERLCATGAVFAPGESVTVAVDGVAVAQTLAAAHGGFTACFPVPGSVVAGINDVSAVGTVSRAPASALFTAALARVRASTAYFVGAADGAGYHTELDVVNPQVADAHLALRFYLPSRQPFARTVTVRAHSRATLPLGRFVTGVRDYGLRVSADQVIAAQIIVRRGAGNPYTSLGTSLLARRWLLAEGYTGLTFHETIDVLNPNNRPTAVEVHLLPFNGRGGRVARVTVPAQHTYRLDVNRLYPHASLSAIITSALPTSVERILTFGRGGYGATGNSGTPLAATTWLFAEGSTMHGRQTFLTILNPSRQSTRVTALLLDSHGHVLGRRGIVIEGLHRGNIRLNDVTHAAAIATFLTSTRPVVAERPFYFGSPNLTQAGASLVYGRSGTGRAWTFPAGDTTGGLHEHLLVFNPNVERLTLRADFYRADGQVITRAFSVAPHARYTLDVGSLAGLARTRHGVRLSSINHLGFVAEQSIFSTNGALGYGTAGLAQ